MGIAIEEIENDAVTGKLDALAHAAIADHEAGRSTKLRFISQALHFGLPTRHFHQQYKILPIKTFQSLNHHQDIRHYISRKLESIGLSELESIIEHYL